MVTAFTQAQVKDFLMDPKSAQIKEPYFIIDSPSTEENITVVASGKNGFEFNKTPGFFNNYPGVLIYRCVYGQGVIIIQKCDLEGEAKEVRVASLRPGVEVEVPSGYGHTLINTGKGFLVAVDNAPRDQKYKNTDLIKKMQGLAYYVIEKKGDIAFERNPNYSYHPQITS